MFTVPVKRLADIHGLAADIDRLAAGTPTLATAWLTSWWEAYGGDAPSGDQQLELCCLAVYDSKQDAKMIGFAPFCRRVSRQKGTGSPKGTVLRWIGSGEVYSDYMTLLAEPGREDHVVEAVAEWLLDNSSQRWDTIELDGIAAKDGGVLKLVRRMQQAGHAIYARGDANCWQLSLAEDWDAYLARLSKSHRKQVRRAVRDSFDTGDCQLRVAETEVELAEMFETFRSLHTARRHFLGQKSCFDSAQFERFFQLAASRLFAAGGLKLTQLLYCGEPVATDFNLFGNGTLFAYQGGMDPEAIAIRPGWLLTIARRLSINHADKARRRRPEPGVELTQLRDQEGDAPASRIERDETQRLSKDLINQAMAKLSEPQRAAIAMHYQQGLALDEISGLLDMPVGTVKSHLHRGRQKMKELLEPQAERVMR